MAWIVERLPDSQQFATLSEAAAALESPRRKPAKITTNRGDWEMPGHEPASPFVHLEVETSASNYLRISAKANSGT